MAEEKYIGSRTERPVVAIYTYNDTRRPMVFDSDRGPLVGLPEWRAHVQLIEVSVARTFTDHGAFSLTFACSNRRWANALLDDTGVQCYVLLRYASAATATDRGAETLELGFIEEITLLESRDGLDSQCLVVVSCLGWGALLERTEIWYDILSEGIIGATAFSDALFDNQATNAGPSATIHALLRGLTRTLATKVNASEWQLPESLAGDLQNVRTASAPRTLTDAILMDYRQGYHPYPTRRSGLAPTLYNPEVGTLWELLMQWSEPSFLELYTDIELYDTTLSQTSGSLQRSEGGGLKFQPVVRLRDRPFPTSTFWQGGPIPVDDPRHPWTALTVHKIRREQVGRQTLAQNASARRNSFFITCSLPGAVAGTYHAFMSPLVLKAQARIFGARRMDLHTPYVPYSRDNAFDPGGLTVLKERGRDFYCANHLFWQGTIDLTHALPRVRLGQRLTVQSSDTEVAPDFEAYIEGYSHSWTLGAGMRTSLTVTRGLYVSPGSSYWDQIRSIADERDRFAMVADPTSSSGLA